MFKLFFLLSPETFGDGLDLFQIVNHNATSSINIAMFFGNLSNIFGGKILKIKIFENVNGEFVQFLSSAPLEGAHSPLSGEAQECTLRNCRICRLHFQKFLFLIFFLSATNYHNFPKNTAILILEVALWLTI